MPTLGPEAAFIFRITHVDNVAWILRNGIHCRSSSILDPNFVSIGSVDLIQKRTTRTVPVPPGGPFNDYVPFYFTPWSIMLYNIKTGYNGVTKRNNRDVAIIVSSLHHLAASGHRFVFTDSHAYGVEANFFSGLHDLREIDWPLLRSRNFQNDPEDPGKKGRYQAEVLVHRAVPVRALLGIACCDAGVQAQLVQSAQQAGVPTEIKVLPNWYF